MIDSRNIDDLHPTLQRGCKELKKRMIEKGYDMGISNTYRDNECQNKLYNQGRTTSGNIVTNAKGGGSIHNYRLAFDIFKNIKGQEYSDNNFFLTAGKIWKEMGGYWGGDWVTFQDKPHFEFTNLLSIAQLKNGSVMPDVKMKWEITAPAFKPLPYLLKLNSRNEYVKLLQELLNKNGNTLVTDGIFGKKTLESVKAYQSKNNLVVDGVVGVKTWEKLNK